MIESFPLYWPDGWARTKYRQESRFKTGFGAARQLLFAEISRMGGIRPILSTNVPLRNDGMPRANMPNPSDPGVAVYFVYKKNDMVFACDKYHKVMDNIYSIAKTIDAMRGIERWGASDMMERAFRGFKALTAQASQPWRDVLGISHEIQATPQLVSERFRELAKRHHPDLGGDADKLNEVVQARDLALKELAS
jgi:hypothetical protein